MKHPFEVLKSEYSALLAAMAVRPDRQADVDRAATKLLGYKSRYQEVSDKNGVPVIFIAASFEREASSDFRLSPAQGDPWNRVSRRVPAGRGPFPNWVAAAIDAYHINGLDRVGAANWTWELLCFYGELFNGFGYRDNHRMHSPYLWGGTNIQTIGKYVADGKFDARVMDQQLGIVPIMKRMVQLDPSLAISASNVEMIPAPTRSGIAAADTNVDVKFVQNALNRLGWQPPLDEDGNYGRKTSRAVQHFQQAFGLKVDFAGPETVKALKAALGAIEESKTS